MSDPIDRQAAIDALAKFVPYSICDESTESYTNGLTDAYNLILQLPSAQTERKKGEWKYEGCDTYSCPFCGDTHVDDGDVYYFCKVCGADMRGDADE